MGRGIEDMEDVAKHWCPCKVHPIEFLATVEQAVMYGFWLVSSACRCEFFDVLDGLV